jgi:cytochrome c oxidase assembly factor CtaG
VNEPLATASFHPAEFLVPTAAMAAYAGPYLLRTRTLRREGRPVPAWRQLCFFAGAALVVAALVPPVDKLSDELFFAHMAQHLALADVAALLVLLGVTGPLLQPLLRRRPIGALRLLSNPLVAFPLWAVDLYLWHSPFLYQAALRHDLVHALEHACFFFFGLNMWLPLFGPLPKPAWFGNLARLGYIIAVRFTGTVLANVFIWSGTVFYRFYASGEAHHGVSSLHDQSIAGALMMIEQSVLTIGLFAWLFARAAAEGERRQELIEFAAARGVVLSEERAARAVAAGRDAALEERIASRSDNDL